MNLMSYLTALSREKTKAKIIMALYSTLSDLSTRIRNGQQSRKLEILVKKTTKTTNILNVLKKEGFIRGYTINEKNISIFLKYFTDKPVITTIEPVSTYNTNKYTSVKNLIQLKELTKKSNQGLGLFILSTSKGILSDYESIEENIGGQIILRVL
jgi:small subunit ribosomal protein S8